MLFMRFVPTNCYQIKENIAENKHQELGLRSSGLYMQGITIFVCIAQKLLSQGFENAKYDV